MFTGGHERLELDMKVLDSFVTITFVKLDAIHLDF